MTHIPEQGTPDTHAALVAAAADLLSLHNDDSVQGVNRLRQQQPAALHALRRALAAHAPAHAIAQQESPTAAELRQQAAQALDMQDAERRGFGAGVLHALDSMTSARLYAEVELSALVRQLDSVPQLRRYTTPAGMAAGARFWLGIAQQVESHAARLLRELDALPGPVPPALAFAAERLRAYLGPRP